VQALHRRDPPEGQKVLSPISCAPRLSYGGIPRHPRRYISSICPSYCSKLLHSYPIILLHIILADTQHQSLQHFIPPSTFQEASKLHWLLVFFLKDHTHSKIGNIVSPMPKDYRIERDGRGRERLVRTSSHREGGSHSRARSTRELLNEAEEREEVLNGEILSLQTRLSYAQRDNWQYQNIVNEHQHCRNIRAQLDAQVREVRRLEDLLADEEDTSARLRHKNEELKEKYRDLRSRNREEEYKLRYEEKLAEVEVLRRRLAEKDELLALGETRIADKNRTIVYLKNYLRTHGFHVAD
jgi:hypothetical protein